MFLRSYRNTSVEFKRTHSNDPDISTSLAYTTIHKLFDYPWRLAEYFPFSSENYKIYIFFSYVRSDCALFIGTKNTLAFQLNSFSGLYFWIYTLYCSTEVLPLLCKLMPPFLTLEIMWLYADSYIVDSQPARENWSAGK